MNISQFNQTFKVFFLFNIRKNTGNINLLYKNFSVFPYKKPKFKGGTESVICDVIKILLNQSIF